MFCTEAQYARCDVEWTEKGKRFAFDHRPFRTPAIMYPLITIFGQLVSADQFPEWNVSFVESLFPSACFGLTNDLSNIRTERYTVSISLVIRIFSFLFSLFPSCSLSLFCLSLSPLLCSLELLLKLKIFVALLSFPLFSFFLLLRRVNFAGINYCDDLNFDKKWDKFVEGIKISSIQSDRDDLSRTTKIRADRRIPR